MGVGVRVTSYGNRITLEFQQQHVNENDPYSWELDVWEVEALHAQLGGLLQRIREVHDNSPTQLALPEMPSGSMGRWQKYINGDK